MLDRASTFAEPKIIELLQQRFVPVAIDQAYQRRQKDAEGDFYRKIASQGPRKPGQGTTQGLYAADAKGRLLGFTNNRGHERVMGMLEKSLDSHRSERTEAIRAGKLDPRYNPQPPPGGLVVRVHSKVLDGYEPPDNEFRRIFQESIGRDNLWVRRDEHQELVRGKMPETLMRRLARYHLVDNTRGEPPMWRSEDVRSLDYEFKNGLLTGEVHLATEREERVFKAAFRGLVEADQGKVTRFDLVVRGRFRGEGRYTGGAPDGFFPFAVSFELANGRDAADSIPPQGSRGWVDGYLKR